MSGMNPEVKKKWIKALRSGEYQQARWALRRDGRYCCLGVLCDISKLRDWEFGGFYLGSTTYLHESVSNWAALGRAEESGLARKNDGGASFDEIADYIEKHL